MYNPNQNLILAALPPEDLASLTGYLKLVLLPIGHMLYEPGKKSEFAYFPINCLISLQHVLASGSTAETAGVGNEGMVGVSLIMGGNSTLSSAVVKITGYAYMIDEIFLKQALKNSEPVKKILLLYVQALITQFSLTAVCNRHHSLEQQLCRWLLLTLDRMPSNEITVTHELVAGMLGVRREGVSEAAGRLQSKGLISCRRGHIKVIDRNGLEIQVCECYDVIKTEFKRLLVY